MAYITKVRLPHYFYDINAVLPNGEVRWHDQYTSADGSERRILTPAEITDKGRRNEAYAAWFKRFEPIKPKNPLWQVIQILSWKHSESTRKDWWDHYQDALFRVFVQPETIYDGKEWKQWYILSPEDGYLVNKREVEKFSPELPWKTGYLPDDKRLRKMRLVPTECCRHWRHETTAGQLPEGL